MVLDCWSVNTRNRQDVHFGSEEISLRILLLHGKQSHEWPVSFLHLCLSLSSCVLATQCQASHHRCCSQLLSLVQGAFNIINVENTPTNSPKNAGMRRAVAQAADAFPNATPGGKHFVEET